MISRFSMSCCCDEGGGPEPCHTGSITVKAVQACVSTSVVGAAVTIRHAPGGAVVGTGTTTEGGFTLTGLEPGDYEITVVFDGVVKTGTVTINESCDPVLVATSSFGQAAMRVVVHGCVGWAAGATITVFQSGTVIGTAVTLGSIATTPSWVTVNFNRISDGTPFTVYTSAIPPYFVAPAGPIVVPAGTCDVIAAGGEADVEAGYKCCGGTFLTTLPYGPTLNATVGGFAVALTGVGVASWAGTITRTVPGFDTCLFPSRVNVSTTFTISWDCGILSIQYRGCLSPAWPNAVPDGIGGSSLITISSTETGHVSEPLVSNGTIPAGNYFAGAWTVSE